MQYLTKPRLILRPAELSVALVVASHCSWLARDLRSFRHSASPLRDTRARTSVSVNARAWQSNKFLHPSFPYPRALRADHHSCSGPNCTCLIVSRGQLAVANGRKWRKSLGAKRKRKVLRMACTTYGCVPRCGGIIRDGGSMSQGWIMTKWIWTLVMKMESGGGGDG
ncbi:hypothetical protein HBI81_040010 [Parastagonospora nodorum]|nr:hypothetical protein HBH46_168500 [Parastagonospora nodorum]KAH4183994.1 hypothetical protein HBH42_196320 [Parastagonospora nodorum]KAH5178820.1 hypothetical protein HBH76_189620 [Parastagonospora nodorum]KAH5261490.1 hypothetical protein HBI70_159640 [Parastagonospora nodorum]KAH5398170.1 hypothetical protein HBI32_188650 [Parastagonospora nodorum]